MKKLAILVLSFAVALGFSAVPSANAQGHGGGRPAQTGLEHAEMRANAKGQKGIENAEAKQARTHSGKKLAKGRSKSHKHHKRA